MYGGTGQCRSGGATHLARPGRAVAGDMAALAPIEMGRSRKGSRRRRNTIPAIRAWACLAATAPRAHRPCAITDTGLAGQNHGHRGAWAVWATSRTTARFYPPPHITAVSWPGLREPQSTPRPVPLAARPRLVKRRSRYAPVTVSQEHCANPGTRRPRAVRRGSQSARHRPRTQHRRPQGKAHPRPGGMAQ
jgi:hypothetical protein